MSMPDGGQPRNRETGLPTGLYLAPRSRIALADAVDNAVAFAASGFCCFATDFFMFHPSGRSYTLSEKLLPLFGMIPGLSGLGLFLSKFERTGGTIGQRFAGVRHVQPDGSPMRVDNWLYRHWPSLLPIAFFLFMFALAEWHPPFATTRMEIRWLVKWTTVAAVPTVLLMVLGYALRRVRPRTVVVWRGPRVRPAFEVVWPPPPLPPPAATGNRPVDEEASP